MLCRFQCTYITRCTTDFTLEYRWLFCMFWKQYNLCGKNEREFFYLHSRTQEGYQTADRKSIRIIDNSILDIQHHIWSLALSMGYANFVDCEITGVVCIMMYIAHASNREIVVQVDENYDIAPSELNWRVAAKEIS